MTFLANNDHQLRAVRGADVLEGTVEQVELPLQYVDELPIRDAVAVVDDRLGELVVHISPLLQNAVRHAGQVNDTLFALAISLL